MSIDLFRAFQLTSSIDLHKRKTTLYFNTARNFADEETALGSDTNEGDAIFASGLRKPRPLMHKQQHFYIAGILVWSLKLMLSQSGKLGLRRQNVPVGAGHRNGKLFTLFSIRGGILDDYTLKLES